MLNSLILGDNLEVLKSLPSESVDLVYIDPPFFSNRNYAVIWGDKGEVRSFEDCWDGGVDTYINWMYKRVEQIHRILKPTGSFYLHCDYHANAELKVYVLNKIFGKENFVNEIFWKRNFTKKGSQFEMKKLANNTDTIFLYAKSGNSYFKTPKVKLLNDDLLKKYDKIDDNGKKFKSEPIELPKAMARKNLIYEYNGYTPEFGWMMIREKIEEMDKLGKLYFTKNGKPRRKNFLDDYQGTEIDNIWSDITPVGQNKSEVIGYPTQKPEALLERIIKASSNEGDVVLDCFVGGGTTVAVAQKLNRNWIGIDQSPSAFGVTRERIMALSSPLFPIEFESRTAKWDYDNLRQMDDFEFEKLVVKAIGGEPTKTKKGGDLGKDGVLNNWSVISVKRSENIGRNVADNLRSAILRFRREKSVVRQKDEINFKLQHGENINLADYDGFIIAFSFGRGLKAELAQLEREEGFRILPLTVSDILPVATKPKVKLIVE
jgi:DNA modification methylase